MEPSDIDQEEDAFEDALGRGDPAAAAAIYTDDARLLAPGRSARPPSERPSRTFVLVVAACRGSGGAGR